MVNKPMYHRTGLHIQCAEYMRPSLRRVDNLQYILCLNPGPFSRTRILQGNSLPVRAIRRQGPTMRVLRSCRPRRSFLTRMPGRTQLDRMFLDKQRRMSARLEGRRHYQQSIVKCQCKTCQHVPSDLRSLREYLRSPGLYSPPLRHMQSILQFEYTPVRKQ